MDEFLPSEMLAKIASKLSYKDVNSLLRTSKTAHAKLTSHRHILPKISCSVETECQRDEICLQVMFDIKDRERVMTANFYDSIESGVDELTEEDDATVEERTFRDHLEGLSLHIQIILSFASIEEVLLSNVDDDLILEELARLMRQSRSRIDRITFTSKEFRSSNLEFITACKPIELWVRGVVQLPDNFYNCPEIQRLVRLRLNSDEKTMHNLSLLSAREILIHGRHNITTDDVEQIIIQWAESTRTIEQITFDFNNSLNKQKCMEWIEHIDNSLVEVKRVIDEEDEWILTRCCDCSKINFYIYFECLVIHSDDDSLELIC